MVFFTIIVAVAEKDNGIGKDGELPWKIPEDMAFFRDRTTTTSDPNKTNIIIMGRKTFESIGNRPLKSRFNICVSNTLCKDLYAKYTNLTIVSNFEEALQLSALHEKCEKIFVIGGLQLYNVALCHEGYFEVIYNVIKGNYDCDTFFPKMNMTLFCEPEVTVISDNVISKKYKMKSFKDNYSYNKETFL